MTMTETHEILDNPVTGERLRVLSSTDDVFAFELGLAPGAAVAGAHVHPFQRQTLRVVEGAMVSNIDGKRVALSTGEAVEIPAGTRHDQSNPHQAPARVVEEIRPAARMHDFFRVFFALARDGRTDRRGVPSPLVAAALFDEFRDSIRPAALGLRVLVAVLAPFARLLGRRALIRSYLV